MQEVDYYINSKQREADGRSSLCYTIYLLLLIIMAEPIIGIDLGTTYSCVACFDPKTQKVEVIESPSGRTMPSWVSFTPEGKLVGTAAKSQVASNPRNTVYDVKRIIGRSFSDPVTAEEAKAFPFRVVEGSAHGEPRIVVDWRGETKELRPEEISAMILAGELLYFQ